MLGWTPKEIRDSWQKDLKEFNKIRKKNTCCMKDNYCFVLNFSKPFF